MAAWSADAVITHSAEEAETLRRLVPEASVYRVPWQVPERAAAVPFAAPERCGVRRQLRPCAERGCGLLAG